MDEDEVIFRIEIPKESVVSIENLTKANKELREERKKLDLQSEEGKKRAAEINKRLDANTDLIKENSSALEKQRLNVGNYTGALDKLVPGLGATSNGFLGMVSSAKALIATPIGAILTTLSVVIGVLTAAFKKSEPVLDFFEDIITKITAAVDVFLVNIDKVGKIIGSVLTLNFSQAAVAMGELTQAFKQGVTQAQLYLGISRKLEDSSFKLRLETAETENKIKALIVASKNRNLSFEESAKLLEEARELEKKLTQSRTDQARAEEVNGIKQIALKKGLYQLEEETFKQFVDRIIESRKIRGQELELSEEEKEAVLALVEARAQAASQTLAFQEKIQNQLDAAAEKDEARRQKELDQKIKFDEIQSEIDRAKRIKEIEDQYAKDQLTIEQRIALNARLEELDESKANKAISNTSKALAASVKAGEKETAEKKKQAEIQAVVDAAKLDAITNIFQQASGLAKKNTLLARVLGIASASIDTYKAANLALATYPPPLGGILAAFNIATGLANVAKISGIGFALGGLVAGYADGGLSGTRIMGHMGRPIRRSNGDDRLVTVKTGEVILNQSQQAKLGGPTTFRNIGVPGFASGGVTGAVSTTAARSEAASAQRDLVNSISNLKLFVSVAEIRQGISNVEAIEDRAQLI